MKKIKPIVKKRFFINQKKTKGYTPGKLMFIGEQKQENVTLEIIAFNKTDYIEATIHSVSEIDAYQEKYQNLWININGLHDTAKLNEIGEHLQIHSLLLEDIAHTGQRPKVEIEDGYIFTIIKMLQLDVDETKIDEEQISIYLSKNILLTFQEKEGDVFEPIRDRIRNNKGRVRKFGLTYLKYVLLDIILDNYVKIMEVFGSRIEDLEDKILLDPSNNTLTEINRNKIELNYFRKNIRPVKEAIANIKNNNTELINKEEQLFFNDLNDLSQRIFEALENYKAMLNDQLMVYSTNVNHKLNDIMKVLTIFSAVFIPITFIAGVYGTNFEYIPELKYKYSYFIMLGGIVVTVIGMLSYFKYKKWF